MMGGESPAAIAAIAARLGVTPHALGRYATATSWTFGDFCRGQSHGSYGQRCR